MRIVLEVLKEEKSRINNSMRSLNALFTEQKKVMTAASFINYSNIDIKYIEELKKQNLMN